MSDAKIAYRTVRLEEMRVGKRYRITHTYGASKVIIEGTASEMLAAGAAHMTLRLEGNDSWFGPLDRMLIIAGAPDDVLIEEACTSPPTTPGSVIQMTGRTEPSRRRWYAHLDADGEDWIDDDGDTFSPERLVKDWNYEVVFVAPEVSR